MLKVIRKSGWTKAARDRDACKLLLQEAKVLYGLPAQWRRRQNAKFYVMAQ
jgi:hypothetical protein